MADGGDQVVQLKADGNGHFKAKDYAAAVASYTQALGVEGDDGAQATALRSNRAACYLALERFEDAVADCDAVLEGEPGHTKALYRRGQAHAKLGDDKLGAAMKDFAKVLHYEPKNRQAAAAAAAVRQRLQEERNVALMDKTIPGLLEKIAARKGADVDASAADMRRLAGLTTDPQKAVRHCLCLCAFHSLRG